MNDEGSENEDIRQLLRGNSDVSADQRRTRLALSRARRQVGQRDTLAFAFVKIWAALARLVATAVCRLWRETGGRAPAVASKTN